MKIVRKSRSLKSRYVGSVDDVDRGLWGRSPGLDVLIRYRRIMPYYELAWKVYSDEIGLPSAEFCLKRAKVFLDKDFLVQAKAWMKLAGVKLEILERY